jgi:hypothetical protein
MYPVFIFLSTFKASLQNLSISLTYLPEFIFFCLVFMCSSFSMASLQLCTCLCHFRCRLLVFVSKSNICMCIVLFLWLVCMYSICLFPCLVSMRVPFLVSSVHVKG